MKKGLAHRHLLAAWLAICVASLIGGRLAAQSGKVDVTGSWALEVVTEAGGTATGLRGEQLRYGLPGAWQKNGLLASNGLLHSAALAALSHEL